MILYLLWDRSGEHDFLEGIYFNREDPERIVKAQDCPRDFDIDEYDTDKQSMPLPAPDFIPNPFMWEYEVDRNTHMVLSVDGSHRIPQGDTSEYPRIESHRLPYRLTVIVSAYTSDEAAHKAHEAYKAYVLKNKESKP
jgi:hypothetical protein